MKLEEFKTLLERLSVYFGTTGFVSKERLQAWFQEVKNIPSSAIEFIYTQFVKERDLIPRNVPKAIKEYTQLWHQTNYKHPNDRNTMPCRECGGRGFIWCRRPFLHEGEPLSHMNDRELSEEISYRCASCQNWSPYVAPQSKPAATRQQLIELGYKILDQNK